jgi:hypothetical protein
VSPSSTKPSGWRNGDDVALLDFRILLFLHTHIYTPTTDMALSFCLEAFFYVVKKVASGAPGFVSAYLMLGYALS